ncbi:hypothetical protein WR25_03203 [Diploscapter pachys]|uniref:DM13 domain-containing protein n=1 Tax=Diploscapter pachys TaxID=2018661 RepID=A0A2A2KYX3_9BILA|nr:hypothetical protein WR25_03203 [Diploscapter pachys]
MRRGLANEQRAQRKGQSESITFDLLLGDDEILRPSAIIPWSQYQRRMAQMHKNEIHIPVSAERPQTSPLILPTRPKETHFVGAYEPAPIPSEYLMPNPNYPYVATQKLNPGKSQHKVIRPQLRGRVPAEPSDFAHLGHFQSSLRNTSSYMPRIGGSFGHRKKPHSSEGSSDQLSTDKNVYQSSKYSYGNEQSLENWSSAKVAIPNGVPLHAGMWDVLNQTSKGLWKGGLRSDRRPAQKAANTLTAGEGLIDQPFNSAPFTYGNQLTSGIEELSQSSLAENPNIVNSIFSQSNAAGLPIQTVNVPNTQGQQALDSLLSSRGPLNQFMNLGKTLLGSGNEQDNSPGGGLLDLMTNALKSPSLPKSSAVHDEYGAANVGDVHRQGSLFEKLITQATSALQDSIKQKAAEERLEKETNAMKAKPLEFSGSDTENKFRVTKEKEDSLKLLQGLPEEEKKLLEAAIVSGEMDLQSIGPALKNLVKDDQVESSKKEKESRLLEWIKANRPKKIVEAPVTPDKLPYYGKYCGSFVKQNSTKDFHVSGALWAVDEYRFVISKFYFQPDSLLTENATFWLGPNFLDVSNPLRNILPSINGFYVRPEPVDVSIFAMEAAKPIIARARKPVISSVTLNGTVPISSSSLLMNDAKNQTTRVKRHDSIIHPLSEAQMDESVIATSTKKPIELLVKGGVVKIDSSENTLLAKTFKVESTKSTEVEEKINVDESKESKTPESESEKKKNVIVPAGLRLRQPDEEIVDQRIPQPLEWYEGFQPLLLTLPKDKPIKHINWVSLRDHKRNETIASIMIPNGPAFKVPGPVSVRAMTPNGLYNISSGEIKILDIKTIVIENFNLRTDGQALWFMVGKDILPNTNGHIVPIYEKSKNSFDCESLRDYYGETVSLRLPGHVDMKDVFWFSIFSINTAISHSHIYLPYNDMLLPPDLSGISTPTCKYEA